MDTNPYLRTAYGVVATYYRRDTSPEEALAIVRKYLNGQLPPIRK